MAASYASSGRLGGRRPGAGRPSKGDRHKFAVAIPRRYADVILEEAEARDMAYGEYVAQLAMAALEARLPLRDVPPRRHDAVVQEELIA